MRVCVYGAIACATEIGKSSSLYVCVCMRAVIVV